MLVLVQFQILFFISTNFLLTSCLLPTYQSITRQYLFHNPRIYLIPDNIDSMDDLKPKIAVRDFEEEKKSKELEERRARLDREAYKPKSPLSSNKSKPFGSYTIDKIKNFDSGRKFSNAPVKKEDLNGVNPLITTFASIIPAGMSFVGWKVSSYLADNFAVQFLDSDIYPVQRAAVVARNLVVGISTLATGFSGVVAIGLFILGITVGIGVLKGELDPTKENKPPTEL